MFKLSEMTKAEKIGVLITVLYIIFMLSDIFSHLSHIMGPLRSYLFAALSSFLASLMIPVIGWGVYYIFFKKK